MSDLITRLENLTWPCRECDVEIFKALGAPIRFQYPFDIKPLVFDEKEQCYLAEVGEGMRVRYTPPAYTSSIDAAMTLVPEGWILANIGQNDDKSWYAELREGYRTSYNRVAASDLKTPTAALALCIAALKAKDQPHD